MEQQTLPFPKALTIALLLHLLAAMLRPVPATTDFYHVDVHHLAAGINSNPSDVDQKQTHSHSEQLTLQLHHRDAVSGRTHSGYRPRLADLLKRDQTRVSALVRRLSPGYQVADFGSDVVSGLAEGSGEYFVRVGVGSPPREQYMVVDSGSDIVWVQCQPCSQCYAQSDPVFNPAESSSFAGIACGSALCQLLDQPTGCSSTGRCLYEVSYGDGSYTKGTLALETLTFGGTTVQNVAMGCGHRNRGLFVGADGLLGLGGGPMSFIGQLGGQVGGAFGYCLVSRGSGAAGSLVFGRAAAVTTGTVWVPLIRNPRVPSFYYVGLSGLGVGGARLPLSEDLFHLSGDGEGGVVMDTGTAVTRLPAAAYTALRDSFASETAGLPRAAGVSIFDTCYNLFGFDSVRVPTVAFYFAGGKALTLPARNFLIPVDDSGTFCFAFAPSSNGMSIVGNIQQEGIQITVDSASGFVGFGPHTC